MDRRAAVFKRIPAEVREFFVNLRLRVIKRNIRDEFVGGRNEVWSAEAVPIIVPAISSRIPRVVLAPPYLVTAGTGTGCAVYALTFNKRKFKSQSVLSLTDHFQIFVFKLYIMLLLF